MGLDAQHPAARPRPPATDFGVYSLDAVEVDRTTGLNVTCRVSQRMGLVSWLRVPPLTPDQVPRGYWFVSEAEVEESPFGVWAVPNAHGTAISLHDSNDTRAGDGYIVTGASWAGRDGLWHDGADGPTCIGTDTATKTRVRLGIVDVEPGEEGNGGPRVVWLRCLS